MSEKNNAQENNAQENNAEQNHARKNDTQENKNNNCDDWTNWKITGPKALPKKLPPPTVWPITIAFGVTLLAFGVLTSPVMGITGLLMFLYGAAGWVEDLRNDQL